METEEQMKSLTRTFFKRVIYLLPNVLANFFTETLASKYSGIIIQNEGQTSTNHQRENRNKY